MRYFVEVYRYEECRYAECRGANILIVFSKMNEKSFFMKLYIYQMFGWD